MSTTDTDRYQSFIGIACDVNAGKLMAILKAHIKSGDGNERWRDYFQQKLQLQSQLQHDDLNFIGHQTNTLYEYFCDCNDDLAQALLYKIEQECC